MNFAVGGARARARPGNVHLAAQIAAYLLKSGGTAPADTLHVIEMGNNDVRDAVVEALTGGNPDLVRQEAVGTIAGTVATLHALGARRFLIWSATDIGLTPAILRLDQLQPGAAAVATLQAVEFNNALDAEVQGLSNDLAGIQIDRLEAFDLLHKVANDPAAYGFVDVANACLTPGIPPFTCRRPDAFLFWDGVHPTRAGHAVLAAEAKKALGL
jgi:outer membrane lipase/esterase